MIYTPSLMPPRLIPPSPPPPTFFPPPPPPPPHLPPAPRPFPFPFLLLLLRASRGAHTSDHLSHSGLPLAAAPRSAAWWYIVSCRCCTSTRPTRPGGGLRGRTTAATARPIGYDGSETPFRENLSGRATLLNRGLKKEKSARLIHRMLSVMIWWLYVDLGGGP